MFAVLIVIHSIICLGLVLVVLMQSSKGEGLAGSAFGGGGGGLSGAVFGGRGAASFLSNATTVLAVLFMVSCLSLAYLSAGTRGIAGTADSGGPVESVITQKAQAERDRSLQQQQSFPIDTGAGAVSLEDIVGDGGSQPVTPSDSL